MRLPKFVLQLFEILRSLAKSDLARNAIFLAGLHSAGNLAILFSIPYLTRVLGPEEWGNTAWIQLILGYFLIVIDWGFTWYGTSKIGSVKDNPDLYSEVFLSCWVVQWVLCFCCVLAFVSLCYLVPSFEKYALYGSLWLISVALFPAWFPGGLERVQEIAFVQFGVRAGSVPLIFLLVSSRGDGPLVIAAMAASGLAGGFAGVYWMVKRVDLRWVWPNYSHVFSQFKQGGSVFLSRVWITSYTAIIPSVLGVMTNATSVGFYMLADRIRAGILAFLNPIIYPLISRISFLLENNKPAALSLFYRSSAIVTVFAVTLSAVLWINAGDIIYLVGGPNYSVSVEILKLFAILPAIVTVSNILALLVLIPNSLSSLYNKVLLVAALTATAGVYPLVKYAGALGAAITMVAAEFLVLCALSWVVWRRRSALL